MVRSSNGMKSSMKAVGSATRSGRPMPGRLSVPNPFLVLGQRRCFDAFMKRIGVDLGDVDREPFFQFCPGHDGTAFRIVFALLFAIVKCCTFEPTSPG